MEKTWEYNNLSSNTIMKQKLTALNLRDNQNGIINNETEQSTEETFFKRKNPRQQKKKCISSQMNNMGIAIETNDSNKSRSLYLANKEDVNNTSILPETADLSNIRNEEDKRACDTIDKNTCISEDLLKEDTKNVSSTKKKKDRETINSLLQNDEQTRINNLIDKVHTLQLVSKKDNENAFVSLNTAASPNIAKHDERDINDKSTSILESLSTEDIRETSRVRKKRNRKVNNFMKKNDKQTDLKTDILKPEAHSLQLINNCNNVSPKTTDTPSTNAVKHKSMENTNNKDISTLQNPKFTLFEIDYEFHEANHAIIETFALNIYFSLCNDDRKTYCLVCDNTFQVQNNSNLRKNLCRHIQSDNHVRLLTQMIEDDKKFLKAGKLFSKLGLARECMRSKDDIVECLLCDSQNFVSKVPNNDLLLHEHILNSKHQNFKGSWTSSVKDILRDIHYHFRSIYNVKNYCCEFCNYESGSEICFTKHLRVPYHMSRLLQFPNHTERFKFHFCAACLFLWFGSSDMYNLHCEQFEHKYKIMYGSDRDHLSEEIIQLLIMCNQNAEAFLMLSNNVCYDKTINYILCDLITHMHRYISNIKAYPFGSRISDLGFPDSDIDIFLDCDNMYGGRNSSHHHCEVFITSIVHYLSLNKRMWKVQEMILHSRTPIIKVQHIPSGFICDISVTNGLAVENTKLIKCFNHAFPLCRKIVLFLKRWLRSCGLLGSRLITSYALTWCVIFYLQTLLVFPSISQLIKLKNSSWRISGWEVGVSYNFPVKRLNHTFEELLLGFFMFYTNFNYKNHVICPLLGQPIEKNMFNKPSNLPQDMAPYIAYMRDACTQEKSQGFSLSSLCVQDPFDLSHNLTKAVHNRKLNKFQSNCDYSAKILKKTFPYLKPPLLS
ncbi:uncharacterized protein [Polyergus mexicanus]|uniref:uncharacterized protein isoform X1 n=1 Tax=Polyergus mexicanus TaxID=615972 RepID=UPI0038B59E21